MSNRTYRPASIASAVWSLFRRPFQSRPERAPRPPATAQLGGPLRAFRAATLWAIALLVATADGAAFAESYRGLLEWAQRHGLSGFWAAAFPLQVDLFIVVGELVLFIAMADQWLWRDRLGAWSVAGLGLAVSVAGNIGHVAAHDLQTRATAAVPPVAAFGALWLGLGVLKRVLRGRTKAGTVEPLPQPQAVPEPAPEQPRPLVATSAETAARQALAASIMGGNPLSRNQIMTRFQLKRSQADEIVRSLSPEPEPEEAMA